MNVTREELLAAHLQYGHPAESLRVRALGQLVNKVLFLQRPETALKTERVRDEIKRLLGGKTRPRNADVLAALALMEARGIVYTNEPRSKWRLAPAAREEFTKQLSRRRDAIRDILTSHFPTDIPQAALAQWFDSACTAFFTAYGDRWVASVTRQEPILGNGAVRIDKILDALTTPAGLNVPAGDLTAGFRRFVQSDHPRDTAHKWNIGMTMFASRLVWAGIAADPLTTRELSDSSVFLDTNALIAIALEGSRHAASFQALADALKAINVTLVYTHATREEYRHVVSCWREEAIGHLSRYGYSVLARSKNAHIQTAIGRRCQTDDDFERFYGEIADPPTQLGNLPISLRDDGETASYSRDGAADMALVQEIQKYWLTKRHRRKGDISAQHDAALTNVIRCMRKAGEKAWAITLDLTMHSLAVQWSGPRGTPSWMSLDPLLQVLAVEQAGTDAEASQFGPLLSLLIANDVQVAETEYTVEDLSWLDDLHRDVAGLPPELITEMAEEIHAARLAGHNRDDPELRLVLERIYQRGKKELLAGISDADVRVARAHNKAAVAAEERDKARAESTRALEIAMRERERRLRARAVAVLIGEIALGLTATVGGGVLASILIFSQLNIEDLRDVIERVLTFGIIATPGYRYLRSYAIPRYQKAVSSARDRAKELVQQELRRES